jgi:alpha-L-fucosidase 2
MLLQSHAGEIHLLPALPKAWSEGKVTGLRARGGFDVGIQWKGGDLVEASLRSNLGQPCRVRTASPVEVYRQGKRILKKDEAGTIIFDTVPGGSYVLRPPGKLGR